ncbi:methionine biosynthesis protein MetW, partial [Escherichia coli]|uniref:methionine biosynthesis protein MetW n=2 Tax=Pseudomonadota TaxID=1224 RepID=UPI003CF99DDC
DIIDPDVLYGNYIYVTQSSPGLHAHFHAYAQNVVQRCQLAPGSRVMDLGSNDGTLLRSFKTLGMDVLGVEFAAHIAEQATASGIPTIGKFFDRGL